MGGGGKFSITGSGTGDYYTISNGQRLYYDKKGRRISESVFLQRNNAVISSENSMQKKHYYSGSKTGRYYTVDPKTKEKKYYAANGKAIKEEYFNKVESEAAKPKKSIMVAQNDSQLKGVKIVGQYDSSIFNQ